MLVRNEHDIFCRVVAATDQTDPQKAPNGLLVGVEDSKKSFAAHRSKICANEHLFLVANIVTTSKALVPSSDALVTSSFLSIPPILIAFPSFGSLSGRLN